MAIDTTSPRTRRAILVGALGGLALLIPGGLGRPLIARAGDGDVVHVGDVLTGTRITTIGTTQGMAFQGVSSAHEDGVGVVGRASATSGTTVGVSGINDSPEGYGVVGNAHATSGPATGVMGITNSPDGAGVAGMARATDGSSQGVFGLSDATEGIGVFGMATALTGRAAGVVGRSASPDGAGVEGKAEGGAIGVIGYSGPDVGRLDAPPATGVYGVAPGDDGRGGVFRGGAAAVTLLPAITSTHPDSGQLGDLVVDQGGRLWFCKGGEDWKQLA
jgi:hypothetical protein